MSYTLIATLGPASRDPLLWEELIAAGATAFRLNTSHLDLDVLDAWLDELARFFAARGSALPLVLDLQGSKWRLGEFAPFELAAGETVELVLAERSEANRVLPVPHPDFFRAAGVSSAELVLNDAKSRLRVESSGPDRMRARVILGGTITTRKGITYSESSYRVEAISPKDREIVERTENLEFTRLAVSYVKDAPEMEAYQRLIGPGRSLIAKLERGPAMEEAAAIARHCDELWVCRGDLGAELGLAGMAQAVADFTTQIPILAIPAVMAGQVLEHMVDHPTPTRSEVCYLYDCLKQGYSGFVLSDEAAIGRYPVESVRAAAMFQ